ncbi:MAG: PAS domain S-box protein [Bacteroidota bacterium]|jgi:PAS domain S-box-containing protein
MRYKILLIEDNSLDINLFDQMLCQTGLKTNSLQVARSLQTGLEMAAVGKPDIIFLDLNLADSTGLDTFRSIRVVSENVPVVILTGLEDEKLALEALHEGAQDYLIKKNLTPDLIARSLTYSVERKKAENELLITKLRQEALIENTKDGIWAVDLDLELLSVNHAFTEAMRALCGRKPAIGDLVTDYVPGEYLDFFLQTFQRAASGERFRAETQIVIPPGEHHYLEISVNPIINHYGEIAGVSFFARNINQRKLSELKIKSSEEAYKLLLETINDGVMFIDNDNIIRFANRKFTEITGYVDDELNGTDFTQLLVESDPLNRSNIVRSILMNEDAREISIVTKSGTPIWFSVKGTPLMDDNGRVGGALLTHTEITHRKEAEKAIREKEQDYSNLLETMNEGLIYLDRNGILKFANKKFESLTGFLVSDLLGNKLPSQIFPETLFGLLSEEFSNGNAGGNFQYELQITNLAGEKMWCMIGCSVIRNENEEFFGMLVTYTNISDRKKAEERFQTAQRELNTFIYRTSHDLKGPLSSILGLIHILEKEAEASPCVKMIRTSAEKLDRMLNEMLNVVRIKREKLIPEPIDFRAAISLAIQGINRDDNFYAVRRLFDVENRREMRTDQKLLVLILQNLIDNSIKYHDKNKEAFVNITVKDHMHGVQIKVEDNGIGFEDAARENIFHMFNKGNYRSEGNGLGLYVVKNAIDRLGGFIEMQCNKGENTVFTIFLPDLYSTNQWVESATATVLAGNDTAE